MAITCCHNCTMRKIGCHSTCEIYRKANIEHQKQRKEEQDNKRLNEDLNRIRRRVTMSIIKNKHGT